MVKEVLIDRLQSNSDLDLLVFDTIENTSILLGLFEIVQTETSTIKYLSSKIIRKVSEQRPDLVYPYFEEVAKWLRNRNSFIKWDGILTLSNLVTIDEDNKFETIHSEYFSLIHDPQMITAANVVKNVWKIVIAKPDLEEDITGRLLEVPKIIYLSHGKPSPECNRIVCGHVLENFDHYFDFSRNQSAIIDFAEGQLLCSRKSVAKKAVELLRHHPHNNF